MTFYDSILHAGNRLLRLKRWFPGLYAVATLAALLLTTPFEIASDTTTRTVVSLVLVCIGLALRLLAANVRSHAIEDLIAAKGIWSIVRFPHYLASIFLLAGLTIYAGVLWYTVTIFVVCGYAIERLIAAEESILIDKYGETYRQWCRKTHPFLPRLSGWEIPAGGFPLRKLYKQEFRWFLFVFGGMALINLVKNRVKEFWLHIDYLWLILLAISILFYYLPHKKE